MERFEQRISDAASLLVSCYREKKACLFCGNGGSASDSEHFVGELVKEFKAKRPLDESLKEKLGDDLGDHLRGGIAAISLVSQTALLSALCNDVGFDYAFAQEVIAYAPISSVIFCFSTSGNSLSVINAAKVAKALGLAIVVFTGKSGGKLREYADICFDVAETETYRIQEEHIKLYHKICLLAEDRIWNK